MKDSLKPGLRHRFTYRVPETKTVPHFYPQAGDFQAMPEVFATGCMVGLFEWACIDLMKDPLDPGEGSLGAHIDFSHLAATSPGLTVSRQRAVRTWDKSNARVADKVRRAQEAVA